MTVMSKEKSLVDLCEAFVNCVQDGTMLVPTEERVDDFVKAKLPLILLKLEDAKVSEAARKLVTRLYEEKKLNLTDVVLPGPMAVRQVSTPGPQAGIGDDIDVDAIEEIFLGDESMSRLEKRRMEADEFAQNLEALRKAGAVKKHISDEQMEKLKAQTEQRVRMGIELLVSFLAATGVRLPMSRDEAIKSLKQRLMDSKSQEDDARIIDEFFQSLPV